MTPIVLWAALACGIEAGYEPAPDGHLEYIIQIEPQLLESLRTGRDITSEVPRGLDVRHYRLTVGSGPLPHIATPAGGQTAPAGGTTARPADAFEARGRSDEAVGTATPQIHEGYEALSATVAQWVVEIDPRTVGDLKQVDIVGSLPPGLPVSRFVISTVAGSAPTGTPSRFAQSPVAPAAGSPPAAVGASPGTGDDDPSAWQAPTTAANPPASAGNPPGSAGTPPTMAGTPPAAGGNPPTSGGVPPASAEPVVPDEVPAGEAPPPEAMPPHRNTPQEPAGAPPAGPGGAGEQNGETPDESVHHKHGGAATNDERGWPGETPPSLSGAPNPFPMVPVIEPLVTPTGGVGEGEQDAQTYAAKKQPATGEGEPPPGPAAGGHKDETKEPPKPWLPFTFALLALFASLGGNVFLGWVAWDSYNRGRSGGGKFAQQAFAVLVR